MKKIFFILAVFVSFIFADENTCGDLYNDFKSVLEPQMTMLCQTTDTNATMLNFYIYTEEEGYTQMMIVYKNDGTSHLYIEGDNNPYKCGKVKNTKYQSVSEILSMIFLFKKC